MRQFYAYYQYVAFLILFPFSLYLWYTLLLNWQAVFLFTSMPVLVAYVIPALGTNVTKLWCFRTKYQMGNFRIYHGFVLGASINIFGYMLYRISPSYTGLLESGFFALLSGGFIGFINWYYDIYAVKTGFIVVYNKAAYEKKSPHEIVMGYAPVYFFLFGSVYGVYLKAIQHYMAAPYDGFLIVLLLLYAASLVLPTLGYALASYIRDGDTGLFRYRGNEGIK